MKAALTARGALKSTAAIRAGKNFEWRPTGERFISVEQ
jgi:hypothetical protein